MQLTTRSSFAKNSGLSPSELSVLYMIRIISSVFLGWITIKYYPGNDYWSLNTESMQETQMLRKDPIAFLTEFAYNPYHNHWGGFFDAVGSFWNDLRNNIILKILAIQNFLSGGNYYINAIFFNSFAFLGNIALYRTFKKAYPEHKWTLILGCFLIPTTLFYSSGLHKDLIVFSAICFFVFALQHDGGSSKKRIALLAFSCLTILLMRNFLMMILLPFAAGFLISRKYQIDPKKTFAMIGILLIGICITLSLCHSPFDPLQIIFNRHEEFSKLHPAASQMELLPLEPTLKSFITCLPLAFNHGFLRPFCWEANNIFSFILSIETLLILMLVIYWMIFGKKIGYPAVILMCSAVAVTMILITGYIVPNSSSVVRYRSLYLPFIVTPMLISVSLIRRKNTH